MCSRKDRHDWKICPYAHPGEVARRRHPRGYTAVLCPAKTAVRGARVARARQPVLRVVWWAVRSQRC
jgi:hypothetical protein